MTNISPESIEIALFVLNTALRLYRAVREQQQHRAGQNRDIEPDRETPASPYSESFQRGLHPRKSSWDAYDNAMFYAEAELRKHDVKNIEKREFDDAALRLAEEEPERLAELVMEARGLNLDDG